MVEQDRDTLLSIRKSGAEYLRRLATMLQQEEKKERPAKKAAPSAPDADKAAEIKRLRDHARVTRELAGMRQANNPPGSFHHNKGLQDEKDADRLDAEADALERGTVPEAPTKKVPAKKAAPSAPETPKPKGPPVRGMRGSGTDIYDRTKTSKPLKTLDRPNADEPVYLPNRGNDQGLVHIDSELGGLWLDLYYDDREPNSFVNEIAQIGEQVGSGQLPLDQALQRLARMKGRATDQTIADRIQAAIDNMDAPPVELPDLPDTVPGAVRRALRRLADIPTARRLRVGPRRLDQTVLDKKIDIVRKIDAGEIRMDAARRLQDRDLHESGDGAVSMWRIFERLMNSDWVVGYDDQGKPITEPNPDWPEISAWLRQARERAYARQRGT